MKKWLPKMIILLLLLALSFYAFTKVRIETEAQTYACIASDVNVQKKYQTIFLVNSDGFNKGLGPQIVDVDEEMQNKGLAATFFEAMQGRTIKGLRARNQVLYCE